MTSETASAAAYGTAATAANAAHEDIVGPARARYWRAITEARNSGQMIDRTESNAWHHAQQRAAEVYRTIMAPAVHRREADIAAARTGRQDP